jgi:hypothetical protein
MRVPTTSSAVAPASRAASARTLQPIGPADRRRYTFAHAQLLERAQANPYLSHQAYRQRINRWARSWAEAGWPIPAGRENATPRYLLDAYPATLADDPRRLTALVSDVGWVDAAIQSTGVDRVLADLRVAATDPAEAAVGAILATVSAQAPHLRSSLPLTQPGYVLRQLCLQAAELGEDRLSSDLRARLRSQPNPGLI